MRSIAAPGSVRELLRVAIPLVLSSGSISLMHVVDRMFLTWYSTDALAASLPAGMVYWTFLSFGLGTAMYVNTFVAQYMGAGRKERVADALWQGIYFSVICGVAMMTMIPFSSAIFGLFGHTPAVKTLEAEYFALMTLGGAPALVAATLSCYYSGRSQTLVIMWVNFAATIANIVLDYLLIFGFWYVPAMGIRGAAIATVLATVLSMILYLWLIARDRDGAKLGILRLRGIDQDLFWRLIRFGSPKGFQTFMDVFCFTLFVLLVGEIGAEQLAATTLAFNLNTLAFVPMLGMGTAISTLVGQRIGEGRPEIAARTTWLAFGLSSAYMLAFAVVYIAFPMLILKPFAAKSDPAEFAALVGPSILLLRFVAIYCLFDAWAIVFSSAIGGAGDTRFCLIFSTVCCWLLMVVPTYVGLKFFDGGLIVAWSAVTLLVIVLGLGFMARFIGGKWKSMKVIETSSPDAELAAPLEPRPAEAR